MDKEIYQKVNFFVKHSVPIILNGHFLRGHYPQKPCALSNPNMFAKRVSRTSLSALYMAKVMIQCEKMKYLHWKSRQVLNAQKPRLPFFFREHPYNISLLTRGNIENRWWKICNIENLYWKKLSNMWWKNQHYEKTGDGKISIKIVIFHLFLRMPWVWLLHYSLSYILLRPGLIYFSF